MEPIKKFVEVLNLLNLKKYLIYLSIFNFIFALLEIISLAILIPLINLIINPEFFLNYLEDSNFVILSSVGIYLNLFSQFEIIQIVVLSLIFIIILKFLYSLFFEWYKAKFIYRIEFILSEILYVKYITSNYKDVLDRNSSELHRNILGDINMFNGTAQSIVIFFTDVFFSAGILFLLLITNFNISIILISSVSIIGYLILKITSKYNYLLGQRVSDATEKKIDVMLQSFGGIKEIIIYDASNFFKKIFNLQNDKLSKAKRNNSIIASLPKILIEFIIFFSFCIVILFLFYFKVDTNNLLTILSFIAIAVIRVAPSCYRMVASLQRIKFTEFAINNIYLKLKDTSAPIKYLVSPKINSFELVQFEQVFFEFGEKKIFSDLNLKIEKNSLIGIFGESGSGKTTFINLLAGLHLPTSGRILIDNLNIKENIEGWRDLIGFVPQNVFILNDTLKKNIAFGLEEDQIDEKKLINSIEFSGLKSFVSDNEKGTEFVLGENGSKLSGGQKQRVGIARALYKNAKLLIFDESTSSLDEKTEKEIINNIYSLKDKFTIILISHKKEIIDQCDTVLNIKNLSLYRS